MAGLQPVAAYSLRIPPGDILVPVVPGFQAMARITMAAIDPSEEPEHDSAVDKQKVRSTLKVVRVIDDDDSEDDDFEDDDEEDSEEDDEELNGGPSTRVPSKQEIARAIANLGADDDEDDDDMDEDSEDEEAAQAVLAKLMKDAGKGKSKALDGDDDDSGDDDAESLEMDEVVVCTLDPEKAYQQPLDLVIAEGEKVFFKVSGNLTVHLTGNYMMPLDEPSDEEDDEDLEDYGEDELDALDALVNGGDESDELDDLEDPRVMEVDSEEEETKPKALPAATGKGKGKGKNKRPAEDSAEEEVSLDNIMAKSLKQDEAAESKKLSKAEKKKQKKLKNNEGEAAPAPETNGTTPDSGKKTVQFAKNLEQGPTPSAKPESKSEKATKTETKADTKPETKKASVSLGTKTVSGVTVDDRKIGTGPAAKKGSRVEMRYIGKLKDGKVFDANKSGKPFSFKLGAGEVIKGWDIGIMGLSAGGERRLTIPASLAYGSKKSGPIPANSELTFDVKCISVK